MSCHGVETLVKRSWDTDIDNDECPQPGGRTMTMRRQKHKEHKSAALPIYRVRYHRAHPPQCLLTTSPLMRSEEDKKPGREISRPRNHRNSTHRTSIQRRSRARSPLAVQEESSPLVDSPSLPLKSEKSYRLEIVQHPIKCAEFGTSPLTRLPLSPPVIVQLHLRGGGEIEDEVELPFLVAQLALYSADGNNAVDHPHPHPQARTPTPTPTTPTPTQQHRSGECPTTGHQLDQQMLYGSLVASPQFLRNYQGKQGVYFLFPDVSVRWKGQYRLGVSLLRIPGLETLAISEPTPPGHRHGSSGNVLARAQTYPFDVVSRSEYTAPAQTPLTQYFIQQGARMYAFASSVSRARFPS